VPLGSYGNGSLPSLCCSGPSHRARFKKVGRLLQTFSHGRDTTFRGGIRNWDSLPAARELGIYSSGPQIKACEEAGITSYLPKPMTSNSAAAGRFSKADFIYIRRDDEYQCPAGERLRWRQTTLERGLNIHLYWSDACGNCALRAQCTTDKVRRVRRWEHEEVLDRLQTRLDQKPQQMTVRRRTIEHVFGTLKHWMGSTHFLTRRLENVSTEMSLHVLAYNLKRVIAILGMPSIITAMKMVGG
jgi:hypothetical protein